MTGWSCGTHVPGPNQGYRGLRHTEPPSNGASRARASGPCGLEWDFRKTRPYSGYEKFEFEIPTAQAGDCYDRAVVRVEEMRQSLRIIRQCVENMPSGSYKSDHPLATPPRKERTMHDIETLITHFLGVSWGPVIPAGEAFHGIEATKGNNGYYLVSDGGNHVLPHPDTQLRPFPHMQMLPAMSRGGHGSRPAGHPGQHRLRASRRGSMNDDR